MPKPPRAAPPRLSVDLLDPETLIQALTCQDAECRCRQETSPRYLHCPAHPEEYDVARLLMTVQGNEVSLKCESGCPMSQILLALRRRGLLKKGERRPAKDDFSSGLTVRELAESVRVDPAFLDYCGFEDCTLDDVPAVRLGYPDYTGKIVAVRYFTALNGKDRVRWRRGDRPIPFSLPDLAARRQEQYIVLVDDEVDRALLDDAGFTAAAVPGPRDFTYFCYSRWGICRNRNSRRINGSITRRQKILS